MSTIEPTVGRVVWFTPGPDFHPSIFKAHKPPFAAHVAHVNEDGAVNVMVIGPAGEPVLGAQGVKIIQDGDEPPFVINSDSTKTALSYCEWMPYQKGQAAKAEAAATAAAATAGNPS
jgi:hypothetical protein